MPSNNLTKIDSVAVVRNITDLFSTGTILARTEIIPTQSAVCNPQFNPQTANEPDGRTEAPIKTKF
jgi:hypothetical protein